jgi:hypothetical protein
MNAGFPSQFVLSLMIGAAQWLKMTGPHTSMTTAFVVENKTGRNRTYKKFIRHNVDPACSQAAPSLLNLSMAGWHDVPSPQPAGRRLPYPWPQPISK